MSTTERKYAMTRIATGDYLLPSNDARTIWRIERYTDGPSLGLDWPSDREVWRVSRWTGDLGYVDASPECPRWEEVATTIATRREAIDIALQQGTAQ